MLHLIDANNVMLRAVTTNVVPGQTRLTIRQRLAQADASQIWVWDGINHNARRQAIYPPYKAKRPPLAQDLFSQIKLFKQLLCHTSAIQITVDEWECDDVIATIARQYNSPITIFTNDLDYWQLKTRPNITLNGVKTPEFEPRWTQLYKAMRGDSSDFIDGIPGFGPKAWDNTEGYRQDIEDAIRAGRAPVFPCTAGVKRWLADPENIRELQAMLLVTHMWEVPQAELSQGVTHGTPNPGLIDEVLKRYFL